MSRIATIFEPMPSSRYNGAEGEEEFLVHCLRKELNVRLSLSPYSNCDFRISGKRIDVKTISNDYGPSLDFNVNVPSCQVSLEQDLFAFVFHDRFKGTFTIAGAIDRGTLLKRARLMRKGETERNGLFQYKCDTYVMKVGELLPLESLVGAKISE